MEPPRPDSKTSNALDGESRGKRLGQELDRALWDERLGIAHLVLGAVAAFVYWLRPATFRIEGPSKLNVPLLYALATFLAWSPYVISWLVARKVLARNKPGVIAFLVCSTLITSAAALLWLNIGLNHAPVAPLLASSFVAVSLVLSALACAAIWRP
jgi:hypothetical protein